MTTTIRKDKMRRIIGRIADIVRQLVIILVTLAMAIGGMVYLFAADLQSSQYFSLLVTIVIAVGSIFVAATSATIIHKWFAEAATPGGQLPGVGYGEIFYRYVIRFAWIVTPLAGGYGLLTIIEILR